MNIREQVRQRLAAVKKTETAAVETSAVSKVEMKTKPLPTSIVGLVMKALKKEGGYGVEKKAVDKGLYVLTLSISVARGVRIADAKAAMASEVNRIIRTATKQAKEAGKKPMSKPGKIDPGIKPRVRMRPGQAKALAGKAPKGTGKLKAFMKENGLDLKTLKALVKHITPSK